MGRSLTASSGKNATPATALNAVVEARFVRAAALNSIIKGEVLKSAALNAITSLFAQVDLGAALNAVLINSTLHLGLMSYFKLDGNSIDVLGANTGTDTAITYSGANGKIVSGAGFNGTSSFIDLGSANLNLTQMSFSAWVKVPNASNYYMILTRGPSGGATYEFRFEITTGVLNFISGATLIGSVAPGVGAWHHVCFSRTSGNAVVIYIDGVQRGSGTVAATPSLPSTSTFIGKRNDGFFLSGSIDEAAIWNRVLTLAEVQELYLSSVGNQYPFGNVAPLTALAVFYWKLDGNGTDSVGAFNGSPTNTSYGTGKLGTNGVVFTGGSSPVIGVSSPTLTTTFTVAMWIFPTSDTTAGLMVENSNAHGFFRNADKKLGWYDPGAGFVQSTGTTPLNAWSHVVVTHDGTTVRFYINGALDPSSYAKAAVNFTPIRVGSDQFANGFVGTIDEVGAWSRVLTAVDIAALYNAGAGIQYPF